MERNHKRGSIVPLIQNIKLVNSRLCKLCFILKPATEVTYVPSREHLFGLCALLFIPKFSQTRKSFTGLLRFLVGYYYCINSVL